MEGRAVFCSLEGTNPNDGAARFPAPPDPFSPLHTHTIHVTEQQHHLLAVEACWNPEQEAKGH